MKDLATLAQEIRRSLVPVNRVRQDAEKVTVRLEMPGVSPQDLDIQVEGRELTIIGRRPDPATSGTWLLRERPRGDFRRSYTVDPGIDLDKVDAQLKDGVLVLSLPVREEAKPRKVDIRTA